MLLYWQTGRKLLEDPLEIQSGFGGQIDCGGVDDGWILCVREHKTSPNILLGFW